MAYNANQHLIKFHNDRVFVNEAALEQARSRRQANRNRLERGLQKNNEPVPVNYVHQGSYAMGTMTQSDVDTSDIDDGVIFTRDSLKTPNGRDRTPSEIKNMVCNALSAGDVFNTPPEVRTNCVRIYYNDGFHVDMPIYRTFEEDGVAQKELAAAGTWTKSSPEEITSWFVEQVNKKSPDTTNGRQMRRIVRLIKYWAKSRASWNMPSGFIISILVDEALGFGILDRDDQVLLTVIRSIHTRLLDNTNVYRPVSPHENLSKASSVSKLSAMKETLASVIEELSKTERSDCNELMAIKALKTIFYTDYWDSRISDLESDAEKNQRIYAEPKKPIDKQGGTGQYA